MSVNEYLRFRRAFYPNWDQDYCLQLVDMFRLDGKQMIGSLSRGQLARVGLISAIAYRPELLLLDEPSSGLDPGVRNDILKVIIRTVADEGRTVVFSSHLLREVQQVCDRVALLTDGKLKGSEPIDDYPGRHRRWTLRLGEPLQRVPDISGLLRCSGEGSEWQFLIVGDVAPLRQWISESGATVIDSTTPALEELFVDFVRPAGIHGHSYGTVEESSSHA